LSVQALSQQTPSTQCKDAHSRSAVQSRPLPLGPQLPPTQVRGATQVASLVQLFRQAPPAQVEGAQLMPTPASQAPSPSHRPAGTKLPLPSQRAGSHTVPAGQRLQPP
jgi:hypothetical protein